MKRILVTLLLAAVGLSLASADVGKTSLMREEAQRKTEELLEAPLPPATQGITTSDLVTTRDINQEIANMPGLSAAAKSVRVGTYRGRVTLTGNVETTDEKQRIEALAARQVSSANVVSELRVKAPGRS